MPAPGKVRAGQAFVEIFADDRRLARGLRRASARLKAFGTAIRGMGLRMMALGAAVVAPMLASVKVFASLGDQLNKMSARTGVAVEELSSLAFAAEQSGADLQTLEGGLRGMQRSILNLERGLSTSKDSFDDLGITIADLQGLSPDQQFKLIADRLSQIEDPTKRAALAMQVFGRAGQRLVPLISGGSQAIEQLQQEAHQLGFTLTTEQAQAAADFTDAWNRVRNTLKGIVITIGGALAPNLTEILEKVKLIVAQALDWSKRNKQLIVTIFKVAVGVLAGGAALVGLGTAIIGFGMVVGSLLTILAAVKVAVAAVIGVFAALLSPLGLAMAAVAGLAVYFAYTTGAIDKAIAWLGKAWDGLKKDALKAFEGIKNALAAGDYALAAKILWASLKILWLEGTEGLRKAWVDFKEGFVAVWTEAVYAIARIWTKGMSLLKSGWQSLTSMCEMAWIKLTKSGAEEFAALIAATMKWGQELGKIDQQEKAALAILEEDRQKAHAEHTRQYQQERTAAIEAAAKARKEWEKTLKQAKQKAEEAAREKAPGLGKPPGMPGAPALGIAAARDRIKGTFSGVAAEQIFGRKLGGRQERMANDISNIRQDIAEMRRDGATLVSHSRRGRFVFAGAGKP